MFGSIMASVSGSKGGRRQIGISWVTTHSLGFTARRRIAVLHKQSSTTATYRNSRFRRPTVAESGSAAHEAPTLAYALGVFPAKGIIRLGRRYAATMSTSF